MADQTDALRHQRKHEHAFAAFGTDTFGRWAERFARFFGTPKFIIGQTIFVGIWIGLNAYFFKTWGLHAFDKYPFILLNLAFSTQAAYAAPLILLAQTRQAFRDKVQSEADAKHRQEIADRAEAQLEKNTMLTAETHQRVQAIARLLAVPDPETVSKAA